MIDTNKEIQKCLSLIPQVNIYFYSPPKRTHLPAITYFESSCTEGFKADNAEWAQKSVAQIDVWADTPKEASELAILVNAVMQNGNWQREFSRDLPRDENVYRKNMRFVKNINL